MRYDPEVAPIAAEWLAVDEQQRIELVERHHRGRGERMPSLRLHAAIHAVVENQIAEGLPCVVRALDRLTSDGLSRHDAVHAVGPLVAAHVFEAMKNPDAVTAVGTQARFEAAVDGLTAESWRRSGVHHRYWHPGAGRRAPGNDPVRLLAYAVPASGSMRSPCIRAPVTRVLVPVPANPCPPKESEMKRLSGLIASAVLATTLFATAFSTSALAADHRDGPLATGDPAADLNDVYLFVNPADPTETILIGTYFPDAPAGARFSDVVDYRFFVNNGATTNGDIEIRCRFGNGGVTFQCDGIGASISAAGRVEQTVSATDFRVFVGLRDDPFFFDAPQFNAIRLGQAPGFRNPGVNSFGTFNTLSIVMGIKSNRLTNNGANPVLKVWASTERVGGSGISAGHSGMWYDTANSGHGVLLQALGSAAPGSPRIMVAYWNVFEPNGAQLALYGIGPINNRTVSIPVVSATGGSFPPATVRGPTFNEPAFGTLNFTFNSCNSATMAVQSTRPGFGSPTINLSRLSNVENLPCTLFDSGQIDRNGRAAINTALMGSVRDNPALKDAYNRASNPAGWDAAFRAEFEFSMRALDGLDAVTGNGVTGLSTPALAGVLLDDRLIMDTRIPACGQYLAVELGLPTACGGRTLAADVIDVSLAGLVGPGVSDNVNLDSTLLASFPFMNVPR